MNYYAQIDADGRACAVTQASEPINDPAMIELPTFDTEVIGSRYDAATSAWEPAAPQAAMRRLSLLAFRRRFTAPERAAIEWAAVDRADQPDAQRMQAAALRATLTDQAAAKFIDLDDADTVAGAQGLEAMGLLAAGRAAEIITAPVTPEELP